MQTLANGAIRVTYAHAKRRDPRARNSVFNVPADWASNLVLYLDDTAAYRADHTLLVTGRKHTLAFVSTPFGMNMI